MELGTLPGDSQRLPSWAVPGTRCWGHGARDMVLGTRCQGYGAWDTVLGTRCWGHGAKDPGSRLPPSHRAVSPAGPGCCPGNYLENGKNGNSDELSLTQPW